MDKVMLYYNPYAGNGVFSSNLDMVVESFQEHDMVVQPVRAGRENILDDILDRFDLSTYRKIIAAGGDGTINTLINALVKHDVHVPIAIFPAGTANDLASYFDIPEMIEDMLEIATNEHYTYMDVGSVNDRYFVNVLAMGMVIDVSQRTNPQLKNSLGVLAYYLKGLADLPNLKPIPVKVTSPDREEMTNIIAMLVMNGRSAGGFKRVAPESSINDGLLDVFMFHEMPITSFVPMLLSILTGQHADNKYVTLFRTSELTVESSVDAAVDIDGENGPSLPLHIKVLPKRFRVNTLEDDMQGNEW